MREIKFQVFTEDWKGVKKCFDCYYLYLLEEIPLSFGTPKGGWWYKVAFINSEGYKETVVVDRDKIRMFTGLKDKTGKEIYEGDTVKIAWRCDYDIGTVKYIRNGFFVSGMKRHTSIPLGSISATCEIIGNIYENSGKNDSKRNI